MRVGWYSSTHCEIEILGSIDIWKYFCFLYWEKLSYQPIAALLIFFLLVCKLCKPLHFGSVKIHKHCLYWKGFSANIYRKIFFNCLLLFSYISWSVNCKSWDSKFHHFFLTCLGTKVRFIFEGFKYFPLWKVHSQLSSAFLALFIWSVNFPRDFFSYLFSQ